MRKKLNARHVPVDSQWVSFFIEDVGFAHVIGLAVSKSKRANRDWYQRRRNKRSNSVLSRKQKRPLKYLRVALELFRVYIEATRGYKPVVILPRSDRTAALAKYLVRYGFSSFQQDGQQVFVLTAHQTQAT